MRRIVLGLMMSMFLSVSYGQLIDYKKETWAEVKKSKLYVVYEEGGTSAYDKALKEAVDLNWKFSQVEYVDYDQFEILQKDKHNFFLLSVDYTLSKTGRYDENQSIVLIVRGFKRGAKKGDISNFPKLAILQTGNLDREPYLPLLIKYLDTNIDQVISGKVTSIMGNAKKVKSFKSKIKKKTLYLLESDLNDKIKTVADIKKDYVGEVSIISKAELTNKIKAGDDINVFFFTKSSTKSYVHIYNAATGEEYYNSFNLITKKWPAGIIPYHFKKWNK
tara:strand:- start:526 stop:1353 length:828 start_codon:yes stop_codon:yes gene_type:complete